MEKLGGVVTDTAPTTGSAMAIVKWNLVASNGAPTPRPRHGHRAVAIRDLMIVFGGGNEGLIDELHVYSATTNEWFVPELRGDAPRGAAAHGIVCDAHLRIFTFGGMVEQGHYSNDLYELQTRRWEWKRVKARPPPTGYGPCARLGHSFTLDTREQVVYLFGGLARAPEEGETQNGPYYLNDLYCLDLKSANTNALQWTIPQTNGVAPSPRESHSAVFYEHPDSGKRQLLIFGGMAGTRLGDLWTLDLNTMQWDNPYAAGPPPIPRSLHTANVVGERMFIFGGWAPIGSSGQEEEAEWNCTNSLAVLDKLDTPNPEWVEAGMAATTDIDSAAAISPEARAGHCSVVINKRIYVWSGRDGYKRAEGGVGQVCFDDMFYLEAEKPAPPSHVQLVRANTHSLEVTWQPVPNADSYLVQIQKQHQVLPPHGQKGTAGVTRVVPAPSPALGPYQRQQIIRVVPGGGAPNVDGIGRRTIVVAKPGPPQQQPSGKADGVESEEAAIGVSPPLVHYVQPHSQQAAHPVAGGAWYDAGTSVASNQPPPNFATPPKTTYITPAVTRKDIDQSMPTNILDEALNEAEIFDGPQDSSTENGNVAQPQSTTVPKSEQGMVEKGAEEPCSSRLSNSQLSAAGEVEDKPPSSSAEGCTPAPTRQQPEPEGETEEPKEYFNLTPVQPTRRPPPPEHPQPQQIHPPEAIPEDPVGQPPQLQVQEKADVAADTMEKPKSPPVWCNVATVVGTSLTISHYFASPAGPQSVPSIGGQQVELEPGTIYKLRVAAINSLGRGSFSSPANLRTCLPGFPGAPTSIKIVKCADGASLSWEEPHVKNGAIQEYTVYLAVRPGNGTPSIARAMPSTSPQYAFTRVYTGLQPRCIVAHDRLAVAHVDSSASKPSVIFRIAAKNEKGYGPATQVRWLQDASRSTPTAAPVGYSPISTPIPVNAGQRRSYASRDPHHGHHGGTSHIVTQSLGTPHPPSQQPQFNTKRMRLE